MALTPEQKLARQGKIGASFAPALMAGDERRILEEWLRLTDHPDYVEPDFSTIWAPSYGSFIEPFALDWHERRTAQPLTCRGVWVPHPELPHIGCTLDAYREADDAVVDCKAPGSYRTLDDVIAYYTPQMVVQRACVGAARAVLLIVHGGTEPREYEATWDEVYEAEVWHRLAWFWGLVESLQPPSTIPASTIPAAVVRRVDMTGNNEFAASADTWLTNRPAAKLCEGAAKTLRSLVEPDVREAYGYGVSLTRDRAGRLLLKEAL
jgi:predicted phage-related endonuclease